MPYPRKPPAFTPASLPLSCPSLLPSAASEHAQFLQLGKANKCVGGDHPLLTKALGDASQQFHMDAEEQRGRGGTCRAPSARAVRVAARRQGALESLGVGGPMQGIPVGRPSLQGPLSAKKSSGGKLLRNGWWWCDAITANSFQEAHFGQCRGRGRREDPRESRSLAPLT